MIPITIRLPRLVGHLERFLRPAAATHGEGVEIRQDASGTTVVACEGRHGAVIRSKPGATPPLEMPAVLVDASALALAGDRDLSLVVLSETAAVVVPIPDGQPETITLRPGALPASARSMADTVEGEIASGMTKAVFEIDPRHLLEVAEMLVATGATTATIVVAPRWNALAAVVDTDAIEATFTIAGEAHEQPAATAPADDPLEFTFGGGKKGGQRGRSSARPKPPEDLSADFLKDVPF